MSYPIAQTVEPHLAVERAKERILGIVSPRLCSGTAPLRASNGNVFLQTGDPSESNCLNFARMVEDEDITKLIRVCHPAALNGSTEDLPIDGPKRPCAWTLHASHFVTQFDIVRTGILDAVHNQLFQFEMRDFTLEPHLDTLTIYEPGYSSLPQVVPMLGDGSSIAILVVTLPTRHVGGHLVLGEDDQQIAFDVASKLVLKDPDTEQATSQVAWTAFFSDLVPSIAPILSGYRVTLTYHLQIPPSTPKTPRTPSDFHLRNLYYYLAALLAIPQLLPKGGAIGFGLHYRYSVNPKGADLSTLLDGLKGSDVLVRGACLALGLPISIRVLYRREGRLSQYLTNRAHEGYEIYEDQSIDQEFRHAMDGFKLADPFSDDRRRRKLPFLWTTPPSRMVETVSTFFVNSPGNHRSVERVHGTLVIVAEALPYRRRLEKLVQKMPNNKELRSLLANAPLEEGGDTDDASDEDISDESM